MPRSASSAPWAVRAREKVRDAVACPTCKVDVGEWCVGDDGAARVQNHAARHEAATGEDPTKYAYGNLAANRPKRKGRAHRSRVPGGWGG